MHQKRECAFQVFLSPADNIDKDVKKIMDIQHVLNQPLTTPSAGKPVIPNPLLPNQNQQNPQLPLPPAEQGAGNQEASGTQTPSDGALAELGEAMEEIRAGEMILDAALAREAEAAKYQKQQDRAELESTKEQNRTGSGSETADERIMNRKLEQMFYWKYDPRLSATANFSQIQNIFQELMKEILSDYKGTLQLQLMAQLDALTLNAIQQLVNSNFQTLLDFLGQYGQPSSADALINGLFEQMAERKPLPSPEGSTSFGSTGSQAQNTAQKGTGGRQMTQGIIYQRDAKARINSQYQTYVGRSEQNGTRAAEVLQRGGYLTSGKTFTLSDLKQAQTFIQYLNQTQAPIEPSKLPYTSEEYLGFSAGMSSLKAQTFIEQAGLNDGTASALKYAMGTYAQEYFLQNNQSLKQMPEYQHKSSAPGFQADSFQKIYRYVVDAYGQKQDAQSAAQAGLKRSLESFYGKQADPAYQNITRYRPDIGFFSRTPAEDLKKELINGWRAVCKDWNGFLQYAQFTKDKAVRFDYTLSRDLYLPFLMSQEESSHSGKNKKKKTLQFMLRLGILVVGIIICLFIMALFAP